MGDVQRELAVLAISSMIHSMTCYSNLLKLFPLCMYAASPVMEICMNLVQDIKILHTVFAIDKVITK